MRVLWIAAGLVLSGLAVLGAFLPVMPTTVFALGAAACFARSSPRLEAWLLAHPRIGPTVRAWRRERAISRRAKIVALSSMGVSAVVVALTAPVPVGVAAATVLAGSAAFVGSRPRPSASQT